MRITFVTAVADISGGARVIHNYAKALQQRGHDVCVISRPQELSLKRRLRTLLSSGRWPARVCADESFFNTQDYDYRLAPASALVRADMAPDADIVIATWWETAEWIAKFPSSKGKRVHLVQGYEAFPGIPKERVDAVLRQPTYKIAVSQWLSSLLKEEFGAAHVVLVSNGVDLQQFNANPRNRRVSATIGLVYSPHPVKDCLLAIRAFARVKKKHPDAQLIMFGKAPPLPSVRLPEGAHFTLSPPQERLRDIYSACDVWLCSSKSEGFGLPVLEAMACRCPVVSTAVAGPVELITNGEQGYLVPIGDADAMAEKIEAVLALSDSDWRRMSDAAHATAAAHSGLEAVNRFEAALKLVADQSA